MHTFLWRVREELQQPVFTAIDALEFPELHDESIPFMAFLKQLTKLMKAAGVRDFMMQARTPVVTVVYMPQPPGALCAQEIVLMKSAHKTY